MVLLYGLGDVLIFKAFQRSDLSDFTIVYQVNAFFNVVFSTILLYEYLNVYQWMGFLLLFAGIILPLYEHKVVIHKNHLLIVFCAAILSLAFINDAHVVKNVHIPTYLSIAFLTPGVITLFFYPRAIKNLPTLFNKKHFYFVPLASLLAAFGSVFPPYLIRL